ncbi:MAG: hypothetical protein RLZZ227_1161 [Pseudomonadota bacterium]|jgi:hypothetical protein
MTEAIYKSRRDFLAGSLAALGSAGVPLNAFGAAGTRKLGEGPALVLYQPHDAHASAFADELATAGFATLALTDDPVRQWRDGLGALVLQQDFVLLGLSNWSDYSVLRGLAAEHRRFPLLECRQRKLAGTAWARACAHEIASLATADDLQAGLQLLRRKAEAPTAAPSLFSWII